MQNCDFKGRDLTGADFSGSDLRGCNFTGTTLIGANFQKVETGQSSRQFNILIAATIIGSFVLLGFSIIVAQVSLIFLSNLSDNFLRFFRGAILLLVLLLQHFIRERITFLFPQLTSFMGIVATAVLFAVMVTLTVGLTFVSFFSLINGEVMQGFFLLVLMVILAMLTLLIFQWLVESIHSHPGTSFRKANLTDADFSYSDVNNTDFSRAVLTGICVFKWVINPDTRFANVYCQYVYLEPTQQNRQPAEGDFTALPAIRQYSFSPCPSPIITFSFWDVPHSCRKCCKPGELELVLTKFMR
ncbi:pentapeptide repeat-containing protein [Anabaena sp. CCY 0017]|uniref:pentapeptide repeat-containing protein n=1 Tax=Anabaena sp. CCY 0017 TaxID=3103866 RepID=UPI0039C6224F